MRLNFGEWVAALVVVAGAVFLAICAIGALGDYLYSMFSYSPVTDASSNADVASQQSMARAAWAMVYATGVQVFVGGVGLAALLVTLRHSATANAISERTAQIHLTPYLRGNLRHIWHFDESGLATGLTVTPSWTNVGQTLALDVAIHTYLHAVLPEDFGQHFPLGIQTLNGAIRSNIGPGGVMDGAQLFATTDDIRRQIANEIRGVVYSSVWFTDSFNGKHFVSVCFAPWIPRIPQSREDAENVVITYQTYPFGNWYTVNREPVRGLPKRPT